SRGTRRRVLAITSLPHQVRPLRRFPCHELTAADYVEPRVENRAIRQHEERQCSRDERKRLRPVPRDRGRAVCRGLCHSSQEIARRGRREPEIRYGQADERERDQPPADLVAQELPSREPVPQRVEQLEIA